MLKPFDGMTDVNDARKSLQVTNLMTADYKYG